MSEKKVERKLLIDESDFEEDEFWDARPPITIIENPPSRKGWWMLNALLVAFLFIIGSIIAVQSGTIQVPWFSKTLEVVGVIPANASTAEVKDASIAAKVQEIDRIFTVGMAKEDWLLRAGSGEPIPGSSTAIESIRYHFIKVGPLQSNRESSILSMDALKSRELGVEMIVHFSQDEKIMSATVAYVQGRNDTIHIREYRPDGSREEFLLR